MSPAHAPVKSASVNHHTRSRFILLTLINQTIRKKESVQVAAKVKKNHRKINWFVLGTKNNLAQEEHHGKKNILL
jgi:hypothetical protein